MKVADVMTPEPVTVETNASLDRALDLMDRMEIRHLPVLQNGELAGMLSDREILERTGGHRTGTGESHGEVRRAMRVPVETVKPDLEINHAAVLMVRARIDATAVVEHGRLVGILSEIDVLRVFVRLVRAGTFPPECDPPVRKIATRELVLGELDTPLARARETMVSERVRHLPLRHDGEIVAMLSDRDLRRALGRGLPAATPVGELVRGQKLETIDAGARLTEAAERMDRLRIGALCVRDGGKSFGIVTTADVLAHAEHLPWRTAASRRG